MNKPIYVDIYGMYNVKPCIGGIPSGNDGPIITAYAVKLGIPVDMEKIQEYYKKLPKRNGVPRQRLPGIDTPPPSRDSLIGWASLGLLDVSTLTDKMYAITDNMWQFSPVNLPRISFIKMIASFVLAYGESRNFLWKKELYHAYPYMFSVPLQDRAYYYRLTNTKPPILYQLIEAIDKRLKPGNNSSRLIRWLKYDQDPGLKCFQEYFGQNHPITKQYEGKMK